MPKLITPRQFHDSPGVEEWRVIANGASTCFRTGSFAKGVRFVNEIDKLADDANHHPDVDLRYAEVTVRLTTHEVGGLTGRDAAMAREISSVARVLGIESDPTKVQEIQIAIDALNVPAVRAFWRAVLNYRDEGAEDLVDPRASGPSFWFQQMDVERPERNCVHVDVAVPHDEAEARVAAALAAGGRLVTDEYAPAWWVLADPEGNEACVATCQDRD